MTNEEQPPEKNDVFLRVTKTELWVIRTAGAAIIAALGWIGVQFQTALIHIAEIRRELEIVKPADILSAVHELESISITATEVAAIVRNESPWQEDREAWQAWRIEIEKRIEALATLERATAENLRTLTTSRWRMDDMRSWAERLKRDNENLKVPKVE